MSPRTNSRVQASLSGFWQRQQERAALRKQKWDRWCSSRNLYAITRRPADSVPLAEMRSFPVHVRIKSVSK